MSKAKTPLAEKKITQEEMEIEQEKKEIREEESKIVSGKYYIKSNNKIRNEDGANHINIEVFTKGIKMEHLDLSVRAKNRLDEKGINYISDLADKSLGDLLKIEKFGPASFKELIGKLKAYGIVIPEDNETKFIKGEESDKIIKDIVYLNKRREALDQRERILAQRKEMDEESLSKRKEKVITKKDIKNDIPDVNLKEEPIETQSGKTTIQEKIERIKALDNEIAEISNALKRLEEERASIKYELNKEGKDNNESPRKGGINR